VGVVFFFFFFFFCFRRRNFFLPHFQDDVQLQKIHDDYKSGVLLSSEIKKVLIEVMIERVDRHKRARAMVTDEIIDAFMQVRQMDVLGDKK
jgi:tryptophanyl-tRNA synthetase